MADGGITVLDGTQLLNADLRLPLPNGAVTGSQLIPLCESEASAHLFGLSLPVSAKSAVIQRLNGNGDLRSKEFGEGESQKAMIKEYLVTLADELKDDPLVISILDGHALRVFMDDEDDFAMLAESLFTDLDVDDRGKLSKNEIQNALVHMGVGMGVPPFSESRDLLDSILKEHGAEGEEQLGQSQFAELLQTVIQDLADALSKKNVTVIRNIKVINGSKLKKILADENLLSSVLESMFQEWDTTTRGAGNKEKLRAIIESKAPELSLPPSETSEATVLLYDQVFENVSEETGSLNRFAFLKTVKTILEMFADQLEANPIFVDFES
ncbi:uncharacterized protein A4U43_C03F29040 [Asparagus officinalis]|uniref:EF-hand domain-containing protein n=1 Tax=Asparagus officinalis TaxID=4686 RepID=A0A5P1FHZ5_ASPOF|nr:uncharacterized protein LOC109835250 [Asparagus officinalis]ONK76519.1 uncharacterized protein A4U43_C03F29040 [Asparagus officinalis]